MSLRTVRSPLAPKMIIEHGSTALRVSPRRQVFKSSAVMVRFIREPSSSRAKISTPMGTSIRIGQVVRVCVLDDFPPRGLSGLKRPLDRRPGPLPLGEGWEEIADYQDETSEKRDEPRANGVT